MSHRLEDRPLYRFIIRKTSVALAAFFHSSHNIDFGLGYLLLETFVQIDTSTRVGMHMSKHLSKVKAGERRCRTVWTELNPEYSEREHKSFTAHDR